MRRPLRDQCLRVSAGHGRTTVHRTRGCDDGPVIGDRWGVSDTEVAQHYGCDDIVRHPTLEAWRGVTVHADPGAVWARVRQVTSARVSRLAGA